MVGDGYVGNALVATGRETWGLGSACLTEKMSGQPLVDIFKEADPVTTTRRSGLSGIVLLEFWVSNKFMIVTKNVVPRDFECPDFDGYLVITIWDEIAYGACKLFDNFANVR